jgi:predicted DsbA family dithiol-disulfide isomerase
VRVEVWSDVVCPWCYIGKRRLEEALDRFEHGDEVEVVWRSFELDPTAPRARDGDYATRLATKYRIPVAEAVAMIDRMTRTGDDAGVDLRFDLARPGNTFDAHRLLHLAGDRGVQGRLKERLMAATFTEGQPIGDRDTLVRLAAEAGIDEEEARGALAGDAYADDVRADERQARAFGIDAVPFFVLDRRFGVPGAQPADVLVGALEQAWAAAEAGAGPEADPDAGPEADPDSGPEAGPDSGPEAGAETAGGPVAVAAGPGCEDGACAT